MQSTGPTRNEELAAVIGELQLRVNMMQSIPVAAWSVTPDGTPDIVNPGWYDYTGQAPEYSRSRFRATLTELL